MTCIVSRWTGHAILFCAALMLQGCFGYDGVALTTIYNNTATDLVVHYRGGSLPWPRDSVLLLGEEEKKRLAVVTSVPCIPISAAPTFCGSGEVNVVNLALTAAGTDRWSYGFGFKSVVGTGFMEAGYPPREYMQLEKDRSLYAVQKPAQWPAPLPPRQPIGFPLQPLRKPSPSEIQAPELRPTSEQGK